jgi:GNAT superfamily N-acetyltransferase
MNPIGDGPRLGNFFVSSDKSLLNVPLITNQLQHTYWGGWLTLPVVMKSIENSLCFGLYERRTAEAEDGPVGYSDHQIGFARVVTDYATFSWLCDVFVQQQFQGKGLGQFLINAVMTHPEVSPRPCMLVTNDAQKLYARFGFTPMLAMKRPGQK